MTTIEVAPAEPESLSEIGAQVAELLTRAARMSRTTVGGRAEPMDFAGFLVPILGTVAANRGSVGALLAGRPGSWEAAGLGDLLVSAGCREPALLASYRTAPIIIDVPIELILMDAGEHVPDPDNPGATIWKRALADGESFDELAAALEREFDAAYNVLEARYYVQDHRGWQADERRLMEDSALGESGLRSQWTARYTRYLDAFRAAVTTRAAELGLTVPIEVRAETNPERSWTASNAVRSLWDVDDLAARLYEYAIEHTPVTLLTTDPESGDA
ncbi:hypothetical protein ACTD5D_39640 [Nocardia takedensis]|uniref:hypothetical protein n=1 Tax=Nocardia takedensis TaxID=259390 RepID=UPI003F75B18B